MTTPQKFVDIAREALLRAEGGRNHYDNEIREVALALQTSHDEGVREEREACAKVASDYAEETFNEFEPRDIEKRIRQRSSK